MEKIVNAMKENPDRENIMKGTWKDYIIKDAIVFVEKLWQPSSPKQWIPAGEHCVQMLHMTSQDLQRSQSRKSWKRLWTWKKKCEGEGFQDMGLGEVQELMDTTPE